MEKKRLTDLSTTPNQPDTNINASKIQALFRGVKFRNKELPNIIENRLKERKIMDVANTVVSQINEKKQSAATKLQNAFRNKKAINEFASKYSDKLKEDENKKRQKELFKKYTGFPDTTTCCTRVNGIPIQLLIRRFPRNRYGRNPATHGTRS